MRATSSKLTLSIAAAGLGLAALVFRHGTRLPALTGRGNSRAFVDTGDTALGRSLAPLLAAHPALSGLYALADGHDAFAARMLLVDAAERSLDVQYYIWEKDLTGTLLFDALRRAAERGVRVRLLLDDNNTHGLDALLGALDAHHGIEVRLFNPFVMRKLRLLGYATDFRRLNRRMHNKSLTADNQATIVGGRNVADHYFAADPTSLFLDLDVLAIGPAVKAVSDEFDRYWASQSAYPVSTILPPAPRAAMAALEADATALMNAPRAREFVEAMGNRAFIRELVDHRLPLDWAELHLLSDDPAKGLDKAGHGTLLIDNLGEALGHPEKKLTLVSGYFVPSSTLVATLAELAERGVEIEIITNALDATDVKIVNAGYAGARASLLKAGIRLFEVRGGVAGGTPGKEGGLGASGADGAGGSTLHAKTFIVDQKRVFIGSFNLDPRSARLNTEQGFVIDSPALAARISDGIAKTISAVAYEVRLTRDGHLYWLEKQDGDVVRHDIEPGTSWYERAAIALLSRLPIDWLL